ncbi:MAG: hypothetical protein ACREV4_01995 [Gammaproteobacteria bacterium]
MHIGGGRRGIPAAAARDLTAERLAVIGLRNDGAINDEVLHRLEHGERLTDTIDLLHRVATNERERSGRLDVG